MFHIFLLCSGLAALVNLAVGYLLYGIAGFDGTFSYPLSVAAAFTSGMGVSYVLNRRFTYPPSGRARRQEIADFLAVSLVGLALTTLIAHLLYQNATGVLLRVAPATVPPETAAHIIAVGVTAFYSFAAHKFISFRRAGVAIGAAPNVAGEGRAGQ